MKILLINKYLYPKGGAETYVFKLGAELTAMGHEVEYFGMYDEKNVVGNCAESYTENIDFHKISVSYLTYPFKIIYSFKSRKRLRKVLDNFKPDIAHINNINFQLTPSIIYEIKKDKIPVVYTAHDVQWVCPNHMLTNPKAMKLCRRCMEKGYINCTLNRCIHGSMLRSFLGTVEAGLYRILHTYRLVDKIICPSKFIENELSANPDITGRTVVMHNFIEDKKSDSGKKGGYALYFGRYSIEKGIRTLLKAAADLPEVKFIFAGGGELEKEVNSVLNIENVGFKSGQELNDLIANADFSILPSEWGENCPFSVMEAQTLRTPVIGAKIGGIPELIDDGVTGLLFESGSLEDLKSKILMLHNDIDFCGKLSENCGNIKYDKIEEYVSKLIKIYTDLLDGI
ncbi:MAG: glycosyltransferase [Clostridia bacterium]|nr:glycosyltransferase [Clostridia bacterium]